MQKIILLTYDEWGTEECSENHFVWDDENTTKSAIRGPHFGETICHYCAKERPLRLATGNEIRARADEIEKQMAEEQPSRRLKDASGLVIVI